MLSNFVLDWNSDEPHAEWTDNIIDNHMLYTNSIRWRINDNVARSITLYYIDDNKEDPLILPSEMKYTNIALLKSHLQKCIRRQLTSLALKTATHLIKMDLCVFLRRIFVIMLEDVCPHECISVLVWLTCAVSKGFEIRKKTCGLVIGVG
jgi:hypothetical protein